MDKHIRIEHQGFGLVWAAGWLFTIGFLALPFFKALLALILWPYYLGEAFGPLWLGF